MSFIVGPPADFDSLQNNYEARTPQVSQEIATGEKMLTREMTHYLGVGDDAMRLIKLSLLASRKRSDTVKSILDLPCGHGRVTRFLRAAFPEAAITACDLMTDGVDFCAKTFNATPVYSKPLPTKEMFPGTYDLIFVGSLFTHLDAHRWPEFLEFFDSLLSPEGILIFTTHGPFVAYRFQTPDGARYGYRDEHVPASWGAEQSNSASASPRYLNRAPAIRPDDHFSNQAAAYIVEQYRRHGFGYLDDGSGFGVSISQPSWVMKQVENFPDLRSVYYLERGWDNHQDACCVIKRPFTTPDARAGHPFLK